MKLLSAGFLVRIFLMAGALGFTGAPGTIAFAQHGGGHAGGGHFSGAHLGTAHASVPSSHASTSPPIVSYGPPAGAGPRTYVTIPPAVHLTPPPGMIVPVVGNHPLLALPVGAAAGNLHLRFSPVMSFSGQGNEVWQDATRVAGSNRIVVRALPPASRTEESFFPHRPRFPVRPFFPIFAPPAFGFFGSPFFGLGLGFGFNSLWWPSCGPFWSWGYGCNALPYYDYGLGYSYGYGPSYGANNLQSQVEDQAGPQIYENPSATAPIFVYGEGFRELVQLYLKDGTIYNVTDYWLVSDQIHCTTIEGNGARPVEHVFDFDQLDLQKTIDVNTARGFRFVLRNEPLEQYLRDHPDAGAPGATPQSGPTGPLQPPTAPPPARPQP